MLDKGTVLISKKVNVYDLLDEDNEEKILQLIEEEKVQRYNSDEFQPEFIEDLKTDLKLLKKIRDLWKEVNSDPKLKKFINELKTNKEIKNKKVIIFTESKETGEYLHENLNDHFTDKVLFFSSIGGQFSNNKITRPTARDMIKENFDPNHKVKKNELVILVSTDILSEGINLHRSNIIINYDLPWNPTRVMQRVGRVNRVGTEHNKILIFNFFPTDQSEEHIGLEAIIKSKIQAFHDTLGEDSRYLTEEEIISSHELFGDNLYKKLNNKKTYQDDEEDRSELQYLKLIRDIRDNQPPLFEKIKRLPKKARSARQDNIERNRLITFFRKGKLKKFFMADSESSKELTFFEAVDFFECEPDTVRKKTTEEYYSMLEKNKSQFDLIVSGGGIEAESLGKRSGRSNEMYVIKRLKVKELQQYQGFTDENEEYIRLVLNAYERGVIPLNTTKRIKRKIEREVNPLKVLAILMKEIPDNILDIKETWKPVGSEKREVILSEFLTKKN